jgi:hypothetical protein
MMIQTKMTWSWIDSIINRQSLDSLYSTPPSLKEVTVLKIERFYDCCNVNFVLRQFPDITPKKGLWSSKIEAEGVYVSIVFVIVSFKSQCILNIPDKYDINILPNLEYKKTIIYEGNVPYLASGDKFIIQIKNDSSDFSFTAYQGQVLRILPINANNECVHYKRGKKIS